MRKFITIKHKNEKTKEKKTIKELYNLARTLTYKEETAKRKEAHNRDRLHEHMAEATSLLTPIVERIDLLRKASKHFHHPVGFLGNVCPECGKKLNCAKVYKSYTFQEDPGEGYWTVKIRYCWNCGYEYATNNFYEGHPYYQPSWLLINSKASKKILKNRPSIENYQAFINSPTSDIPRSQK